MGVVVHAWFQTVFPTTAFHGNALQVFLIVLVSVPSLQKTASPIKIALMISFVVEVGVAVYALILFKVPSHVLLSLISSIAHVPVTLEAYLVVLVLSEPTFHSAQLMVAFNQYSATALQATAGVYTLRQDSLCLHLPQEGPEHNVEVSL